MTVTYMNAPATDREVIEQIRCLVRRQRRNDLKRALLYAVLRQRGWKPKDIAKATNTSYRAIMYDLGVYDAYCDGIISKDFITTVGLRKAYYVAQSARAGFNLRDYLPDVTIAAKTDEAIRKMTNEDYRTTTRTMTLYLTDRQRECLYSALERYGAKVSPNRKKCSEKEEALMSLIKNAAQAGLLG